MEFFASVLRVLNWEMDVPTAFGWFHIMWWIISIGAGTTYVRASYGNRSAKCIIYCIF